MYAIRSYYVTCGTFLRRKNGQHSHSSKLRPRMYPAIFQLPRPERSRRLFLIFRPLLAIPHMVWAMLYGFVAGIIQFLSFWAIIFSGRHPKGLWSFVITSYSIHYTKLYEALRGGFSLSVFAYCPLFTFTGASPCSMNFVPTRLPRWSPDSARAGSSLPPWNRNNFV